MPDPQGKKILTDEELDAMFGGPSLSKDQSHTDQVTTKPVEPVAEHGRTMRPGMLPYLGAMGTRLVGGLASGIVGAVPSPATTVGAGLLGALTETAAQKIESPDPVDKSTVALETGLSAIPLGKIYKGLEAGGSIAKQVIANMVRGAGVNEAGTVARRYNSTGNLLPQSAGEAVSQDAAGTTLGALFGLLGMNKVNKRIGGEAEPPVPTTIPDEPEAQLVAGMTGGPTKPANLIKQPKTGPLDASVMQREPSGVPRTLVKPGAPVENRGLIVKGRALGEVGGPELTTEHPSRHIEEAAIAPGVADEQGRIAARPSKIKNDVLDSDGIARRPAAVQQGLAEEVQKAADIAKAQRKASEKIRAEEERLKKQEQNADLQDVRNRAGATDLGKQQAQVAKSESQMLDSAQQEANKLRAAEQKAQKEAELKTRQKAAQDKIDELINSGEATEGPTTLSETTEKVPTASGNQVLKTSLVKRPVDPEAGDLDIGDVPSGPAPKPTPTNIEKLDPAKVAASTYGTEKKALEAIAATGRRGKARPLGQRKWGVVFETEGTSAPPPEPPAAAAPVAPKGPKPTPGGATPTSENPMPGESVSDYQRRTRVGFAEAKRRVDAAQGKAAPGQGSRSSGNSSVDARLRKQAARGVAPVAPQKPVVPAKGEVAPVVPESIVAAPKALPEASSAPIVPQDQKAAIEAEVNGPKPPEPPPAPVPVTSKPAPKKPSGGATAVRKGEIDALTREDVAKWTREELTSAQQKYPKDKRLQTIIADELKKPSRGPTITVPDELKNEPRAVAAATKTQAVVDDAYKYLQKIKAKSTGKPESPPEPSPGPPATPPKPPNTPPPAEPVPVPAKPKGPKPMPPAKAEAAAPKAMTTEEMAAKHPVGSYVQVYSSEGRVLTHGPFGVRVKFTSGRMKGEQGAKGYYDVRPEDILTTTVPEKPKSIEGPDRVVEPVAPAKAEAKAEPTLSAATKKVTVDLAGAKDGAEVRNRIVNELQKYKVEVDAAKEASGIDEKGRSTYQAPPTRTIEVPGGPSITVNADQVENAIARLEKGLTAHDMGGPQGINPAKAFSGIVDRAEPRPTNVTVPVDHGSNFNAKGEGSAPNYKLDLPNLKATDRPTSGPTEVTQPKAEVVPAGAPNNEHLDLASKWAYYNDIPANTANIRKIMKQLDADTLRTMLKKRGVEVDQTTYAAPKTEAPAAETPSVGQENGPVSAKPDLNDLAIAETDAWEKYWTLKRDPNAKPEDVRAAGKAAGEARSALAKASKETGQPVPFSQPPAKATKPAGKGPTSDEIMALPPEQQEAALKDIVAKAPKAPRKRLTDDERGAVVTQLAIRAGLSTAGALAGAATTPDDPFTGALLGGSFGFYAPSLFRALASHVRTLPAGTRAASEQALGQHTHDTVMNALEAGSKLIPDLYRASLLSKPPNLVMNMWVGPYGSAIMGSLEQALAGNKKAWGAVKELLHPTAFLKEWFAKRGDAADAVYNANERGDLIGGAGPKALQKVIAYPADAMTAGDMAARDILTRHWATEAEARELTLTSEPVAPFNKSMANARKTRVNGVPSFLLSMALPFYRTNANQWEQSLLRLPYTGAYMRKRLNLTPISPALRNAQFAISGGTAAMSYALGRNTPKDKQALTLKFLNNFAGPYGMTATAFYVAGVASQHDTNMADQVGAAAIRLITKELPLPTTDTMVSILKLGQQLTSGQPVTLPYGVVPPVLSSKENWNIPALERAVAGDPEPNRPTVKEYGPGVVLVDNPQLRPKPKTSDEIEMDKMRKEQREMQQDREFLQERRRLRQEQRDAIR